MDDRPHVESALVITLARVAMDASRAATTCCCGWIHAEGCCWRYQKTLAILDVLARLQIMQNNAYLSSEDFAYIVQARNEFKDTMYSEDVALAVKRILF